MEWNNIKQCVGKAVMEVLGENNENQNKESQDVDCETEKDI